MRNFDWRTRFRNKTFLIALFSAVLIAAQQIATAFGFDLTVVSEKATDVFNAILTLLIVLGVVVDPLTEGISDKEDEE